MKTKNFEKFIKSLEDCVGKLDEEQSVIAAKALQKTYDSTIWEDNNFGRVVKSIGICEPKTWIYILGARKGDVYLTRDYNNHNTGTLPVDRVEDNYELVAPFTVFGSDEEYKEWLDDLRNDAGK